MVLICKNASPKSVLRFSQHEYMAMPDISDCTGYTRGGDPGSDQGDKRDFQCDYISVFKPRQ